jgi:hypothetical protein
MELTREFFSRVQRTIMTRPYVGEQTDILGQSGTAWAKNTTIYGDNWYLDPDTGLIEIYGAGAAICFHHLLPRKNKYEKEGLYLRLKLAYRTTANANINIRNFSGGHVTLPNSLNGAVYDDPQTYWWVTDDLTLNINSIYTDEKCWIQRVDWEWMSKDVIYSDEIKTKDIYINRSIEEVEKLYIPQKINKKSVTDFLLKKIEEDEHFAKRCLALLAQDSLMDKDLTQLFEEAGLEL